MQPVEVSANLLHRIFPESAKALYFERRENLFRLRI